MYYPSTQQVGYLDVPFAAADTVDDTSLHLLDTLDDPAPVSLPIDAATLEATLNRVDDQSPDALQVSLEDSIPVVSEPFIQNEVSASMFFLESYC
jgi:hypothetical protein